MNSQCNMKIFLSMSQIKPQNESELSELHVEMNKSVPSRDSISVTSLK